MRGRWTRLIAGRRGRWQLTRELERGAAAAQRAHAATQDAQTRADIAARTNGARIRGI